MSEWQPIETAHDDEDLLYYGEWFGEINHYLGTSQGIGRTEGGPIVKARWQDAYGIWCIPTHWMPLPDPPKTRGE